MCRAVKPYFTHERKRVSDPLIEMRLKGVHTAIMLMPAMRFWACYSGIRLEVIVGDIQDEYDEEAPELLMVEAGCWQVVGGLRLAILQKLSILIFLQMSLILWPTSSWHASTGFPPRR